MAAGRNLTGLSVTWHEAAVVSLRVVGSRESRSAQWEGVLVVILDEFADRREAHILLEEHFAVLNAQ